MTMVRVDLQATRGDTIPGTFFGMHFDKYSQPTLYPGVTAQPYVNVGQKTYRMWGATGEWKTIQVGGQGTFDWTRLDYVVDGARAAGATEVIFTIGGSTPVWAAGGLDNHPTAKQFNQYPPIQESYWTDFIAALAARYIGRITAYGVWNEPNLEPATVGTPAQMVRWAQLAYETIKAIDPAAKVITPTQSGIPDAEMDYFSEFYRLGGADYCDIIGIHGYHGANEPESIPGYVAQIRSLADNAGHADKPIWNVEFGVGYWREYAGGPRRNLGFTGDAMPDDRAAGRVVRAMMMSWIAGCKVAAWYSFDGTHAMAAALNYWFNGSTADLTILKPAGVAYRYMATLLTGGTLGPYRPIGDLRRAYFTTAAGRKGVAYWSRDFTTATVDVTGAMNATDVLGETLDISSGTLTATPNPAYVFYT